jgi:hypothetical protein
MSDEVDRIVSAWKRERPDLDVAPLEILSRITRVARQLDIARRNAFSHHGLETWGFDVLAALRRAGKPYQLTPGQLMHETLVSSGTITHRLDLLEGAGFLFLFSHHLIRYRFTPVALICNPSEISHLI